MQLRIVNRVLSKFGYIRKEIATDLPVDIKQDQVFLRLYSQCKPYTMTSVERMFGLYQSINYILDNKIAGDFVECGVWKGGSSMMIALTLQERAVSDRSIYLYDTFEGMSEPTDNDRSFSGVEAAVLLEKEDPAISSSVWCVSSLDEVKSNLKSTGYPFDKLLFIQGKVEDTLPGNIPGPLALLRLDTDWYESTKIEMDLLYPLLVKKGVLIIDDFGHWQGAKKAVMEYFKKEKLSPYLNRLDYTGRLIIKQ